MVAAPGGFRRRAPLWAIAALALLAVGIALQNAKAADRSTKPPGGAALRLMLRLHDLPRGYSTLGSLEAQPIPGVLCDSLNPGEPQPAVTAFVTRFSPAGCLTTYWRLYSVPGEKSGPPLVGTGALDMGSIDAAEAGLEVTAELLSHVTEDDVPKEVVPSETIGDATRLLHWRPKDGLEALLRARFGSFLAWRSGDVLAVVFANGHSFAAADRAAVGLAHFQQAHIERPTPYTPAERDDTEVWLDNPHLKFPVIWLGRTFSPGHGLHRARLLGAFALNGRPTIQKLGLEYSRHIYLDAWTEAGWDPEKSGMEQWRWRCTVTRELTLAHGHAVLYGSFGTNYKRCPAQPPHRYSAVIHTRGMAVVAGTRPCATCLGLTTASGEYNSFRGLEAIARGLRVRPGPRY